MFQSFHCSVLKHFFSRYIPKYLHPWNSATSGIQCWFQLLADQLLSSSNSQFSLRKGKSMLLSLCLYHCDHSLHCPIEQELEWLDKEADWNPQIMSFCPLWLLEVSSAVNADWWTCTQNTSTFTMCVYSKRSIHILLSQTYFLPVF